MSSGHNTNHTNRGRNNGGNGSNGSNNRRARRPLPHQRNQQNQSVVQNRTEAAPTSAPARISEVSMSLEPEGMSALYDDQSDRPIREVESSVESSTPIPGAPESEQPELGAPVNRPEASSGQLRTNRRSPQLIPSTSPGQAPAGKGPALHSIRAPFAPGQNHVHTAGNLRGQAPASGADAPGADRSDGYDPTERRGEDKVPPADPLYQPPRSEAAGRLSPSLREPEMPAWRPPIPQRANDDAGDLWPRRAVPGRSEQSSRDERPAAWSRQEQGTHEPVSFEGRDVRGDIGELIDSLHELFARDRGIASQNDTSRCGVCYLHFSLSELQYREEEGFYVCPSCERALAHTRIVMVRRQQHS